MNRFSSISLISALFFVSSISHADAPTLEQTLQEITARVAETGTTKDKSGETGFVQKRFTVMGASLLRVQIQEESTVVLSATDTPTIVSVREYEFAPGAILKLETRQREGGFGPICILDLQAKDKIIKIKQTASDGKVGEGFKSNLILRVNSRDSQKALEKAFLRLIRAANFH